jgi:hypothetical protein
MNNKLIVLLTATALLGGCKTVTVRHTVPVVVTERHVHHHPPASPRSPTVIVQQHVHVATQAVDRAAPPPRPAPPEARPLPPVASAPLPAHGRQPAPPDKRHVTPPPRREPSAPREPQLSRHGKVPPVEHR